MRVFEQIPNGTGDGGGVDHALSASEGQLYSDWIRSCGSGMERFAAILGIAAKLLEELEQRHSSGIYSNGLSDRTVRVSVPGNRVSLLPPLLPSIGYATAVRKPNEENHSVQPLEPPLEQPWEQAMFLAPEQSGTLNRPIGPPADLYSLGVLLYRSFCGRDPVPASNLSELLLQQMCVTISSTRMAGYPLPRSVDEFVLRLLKQDPSDRYQSARAALNDVREILHSFEAQDGCSVILGQTDHREMMVEPSLVGRDPWLQRFKIAKTRGSARQCRWLILSSQGEGKTRILDEIAKESASHGVLVLQSLGISDECTRPLYPFIWLGRELERVCDNDVSLARALTNGLSPHSESLTLILPWLFQAGQAAETTGPEKFAGWRLKRAIECLLDLLNDQPNRILLVLDDFDRADELSRELLGNWLQKHCRDSYGSLMIIAAGQSNNNTLWSADFASVETLPPLSANEISLLLRSMAGVFPDEAIQLAADTSGGNAALAISLLQGLIESESVIFRDGAWSVCPDQSLSTRCIPKSCVPIGSRTKDLAPSAQLLLTAGAILGRNFRLSDAQKLAELDREDTIDALESVVQRQILWSDSRLEHAGFVQDHVRQRLLSKLDSQRRSEWHRKAANMILADDHTQSYELANHFDASGDGVAAIHYALLAARHSQLQFANVQALRYYRIAEDWIPESDRFLRSEIREAIGEIHLHTGAYDAAETAFRYSLSIAENSLDRARLIGLLGDVEFRRRESQKAKEHYVSALELCGVRLPKSSIILTFGLVWQAIQQIAHSIFGVRRSRKPASSLQRLRWNLLSRLSHTIWFSRASSWTLFAHLRALNEAERFQDTPELARSYSEHAPICGLLGFAQRAEEATKKSLQLRRNANDDWGRGQSLAHSSIAQLAAARFQACIAVSTEAIEILEKSGDVWEANVARYQRACALYRSGRFREALADAERMHQSAVAVQDDQAAGIGLDIWIRCAPNEVPAELVLEQAKVPRADAQYFAQAQLALALLQLREGQWKNAEKSLSEALARCHQAGLVNTYTSPLYAWHATALRQLAGSTPRLQVALFRKRLSSAKHAAKKSVRIAKRFPADLPHALRETAMIDALAGKTERAVSNLRQSVQAADRLQSPMAAWKSLSCLREIGELCAGTVPRTQFLSEQESARLEWLRSACADSIRCLEGSDSINENLSLIDRFDTLLEDGRRIVRSLDRSSILYQACLAAQHLLRGQTVFIYARKDGHSCWQVADGLAIGAEGNKQLALLLADECFIQRIENLGSTGVLPWDVRNRFHKGSLLSTPIRVRKETVAYLLVGHCEIENLFGNDELQVAEFIATLAGAALENSEGFDKLHRLNATLEQRVAERTAAAEQRAAELVEANAALRRTEGQLRDAIEAANAASAAKSQFFATMSHEIRTPLNGILGLTRLALVDSQNEKQSNFLKTIHRSGDTLLRLLNDLLDFSKIEVGKMSVESIAMDPHEVLKDVVGLLSISAWQKGLEVACYVSPAIPNRLAGDPMRLSQVLLNLLGNAIKFTTAGYVEVRAELCSSDSNRWKIAVIDTGIGIPLDKQSVIFEAFSQADNSTTRKFGGTGLGLSIATELVRLMDGELNVESRSECGSTFTIVLPVVPMNPSGAETQQPIKRFVGQSVLVVDPCHGSRRCFEQSLCDLGANVVSYDGWSNQTAADRPAIELFDWIVVAGSESAEIMQLAALAGIECWRAQGPTQLGEPGERRIVKPFHAQELIDALAQMQKADGGLSRHPAICGLDPTSVETPPTRLEVLVAEDGVVNQCVLVGLLELSGHKTTIANDGQEAVEFLRQRSFDVCLMDLDMPNLDGIAATRQIRSQGNSLPVFAMTAHHDQHHADRCYEAGMNGYLTKPIVPEDLQRVLSTVIIRNSTEHRLRSKNLDLVGDGHVSPR